MGVIKMGLGNLSPSLLALTWERHSNLDAGEGISCCKSDISSEASLVKVKYRCNRGKVNI